MNKFEDIPTKDRKATPLDKQFEKDKTIYEVKLGVGGGVTGGRGMDQYWIDQRTRGKIIPEPIPEIIKEIKTIDYGRRWGHVDPVEVLSAWEESGHNKAKAARIMKVRESSYRNWIAKFLPESTGDARHKVTSKTEVGDGGHNQR